MAKTALISVVVNAETADECLAKLQKVAEIGVVLDVRLKKFSAEVIVDEPTWDHMDFNTKTGLAEVVACSVLGPGTNDFDVEILSNLTNHVLGSFVRGELTVEKN